MKLLIKQRVFSWTDTLGLGDDGPQIIEFLKKVADGKASVHDLTPVVLSWLTDKNMTTKLAVSFK